MPVAFRPPTWVLTGQHNRQTINIGDQIAVYSFVECKQSSLMSQELAKGNLLFTLLRKLRPVPRDGRFVVEPAPRVKDGQRHRGQPLCSRPDDDHRVLLPRLACFLIPDTTPEIDHLLAVKISATSAA